VNAENKPATPEVKFAAVYSWMALSFALGVVFAAPDSHEGKAATALWFVFGSIGVVLAVACACTIGRSLGEKTAKQ
jgi:peptidoglycan/LPS O-acetylase OafA/YrhL